MTWTEYSVIWHPHESLHYEHLEGFELERLGFPAAWGTVRVNTQFKAAMMRALDMCRWIAAREDVLGYKDSAATYLEIAAEIRAVLAWPDLPPG
jgi:hypothetical protein